MKQFHSRILRPAILRPLSATLIVAMFGSSMCACSKKSEAHPDFKDNIKSQMSTLIDDHTSIRYASDYPIPIGEKEVSINGEWCIRKTIDNPIRQNEDEKRVCLNISSKSHGTTDSVNYVVFNVYDTADDAASFYNEWKAYCLEQGGGRFEEGDKWFISQVPGVYDAGIVSIYYLEENVMMEAEIDIWSEWATNPDEETQPPKEPVFDRATLRDYVIDHAPELRTFVLDEVLTTAPYAWLLNPEDSVNYASKYKLDVGDSKTNVSDGWTVEKLNQDGLTYLHLSDPNATLDSELFHRMEFNVYDNAHDAIVAYDKLIETFESQEGYKVYHYTKNFIVEIPDPSVGLEGEISRKYYLIDNIILEGTCLTEYFLPSSDAPRHITDRQLDSYLEKHDDLHDFSEIKKYVLEDILGYS